MRLVTVKGEEMAEKKIALITGAGGGIGAGIAKALAADGFTVVCIDKDAQKVEAVALSIPGSHWFAVDISKESEILSLREQMAEKLEIQRIS
jgi:NAD(P)-dependent dehydrogenase (short-subunit alcohol dehydrogenase family)